MPKKTVTLNSQGLFHYYKLLFQKKYVCKHQTMFCTVKVSKKTLPNTRYRKTLPTFPIAVLNEFFHG